VLVDAGAGKDGSERRAESLRHEELPAPSSIRVTVAKVLRSTSKPVGLRTGPRTKVGSGCPVWRIRRSTTLKTRHTSSST
jgi:hypothetical protein